MATRKAELYDEDFYQWSREQAAALRRLSAERWNGPLDLEHLALEVEDLGDERRNAVRSQLRRLIEHCLKLEHSPATDPRAGRLDTIDHARAEIADRVTPTIRRDAEAQLPEALRPGARVARRALERHGEGDATAALPGAVPLRPRPAPRRGVVSGQSRWTISAWVGAVIASGSAVRRRKPRPPAPPHTPHAGFGPRLDHPEPIECTVTVLPPGTD